MNKTELVEAIAKKTTLPKKEIETVLASFVETVEKSVKKGEKVQLVGFGTFELSKRGARKGHNPQTGEEIRIAAVKVPKFKAGKAFKDLVAGKKK